MVIHIRRGDYVTHSATAQNRGLCSLKYYCAAIEQVLPHTVKPYFFHVFGQSCLDSKESFTAWSCNLHRPRWSGHCVSKSASDVSLRSSNYSQRQLQLVGGVESAIKQDCRITQALVCWSRQYQITDAGRLDLHMKSWILFNWTTVRYWCQTYEVTFLLRKLPT